MEDYEPMSRDEAEEVLRSTPPTVSSSREDFAVWMEALAVSADVDPETIAAIRHRVFTLDE